MHANVIGWGVIGFFVIGGAILWVVMPEVLVGQIWVGVASLLTVIFLLIGRGAKRARDIIKAGIRGEATILGAEQTGVYINNQPRVKLKLHVQSPYSEFEDEKTETVPLISLGLLTSGRPLVIYMDPQNSNEYVIDWSSSA